jgi:hypothetical protein
VSENISQGVADFYDGFRFTVWSMKKLSAQNREPAEASSTFGGEAGSPAYPVLISTNLLGRHLASARLSKVNSKEDEGERRCEDVIC